LNYTGPASQNFRSEFDRSEPPQLPPSTTCRIGLIALRVPNFASFCRPSSDV
jgi:hypothetical protein